MFTNQEENRKQHIDVVLFEALDSTQSMYELYSFFVLYIRIAFQSPDMYSGSSNIICYGPLSPTSRFSQASLSGWGRRNPQKLCLSSITHRLNTPAWLCLLLWITWTKVNHDSLAPYATIANSSTNLQLHWTKKKLHAFFVHEKHTKKLFLVKFYFRNNPTLAFVC